MYEKPVRLISCLRGSWDALDTIRWTSKENSRLRMIYIRGYIPEEECPPLVLRCSNTTAAFPHGLRDYFEIH